MENKFKPCPFCGVTEKDDVFSVQSNQNRHHYYVYCDLCDSTGPLGDNEEKAIELWNCRKWFPQGNEHLEKIAAKLTELNKDELFSDVFRFSENGWNIDAAFSSDFVIEIIDKFAKRREKNFDIFIDAIKILKTRLEKIEDQFDLEIFDTGSVE